MNKGLTQNKSSENFNLQKYLEKVKLKSSEKNSKKKQQYQSPYQITNKYFKNEQKIYEDKTIKQLQHRYKQLQQKYRDLLQKAKMRNNEHENIKAELDKYKIMHEKDAKQIERLRCILGFIKRQNAMTQVDEDMFRLDQKYRVSRVNKNDQSTQDQIKFKNSAEKFHQYQKQSPTGRISKRNNQLERQKNISNESKNLTHIQARFNNYQKLNTEQNKLIKKLSNSPYSKYRFIPDANMK